MAKGKANVEKGKEADLEARLRRIEAALDFTPVERAHLYALVLAEIERGEYYGNKAQHEARLIRMCNKLAPKEDR